MKQFFSFLGSLKGMLLALAAISAFVPVCILGVGSALEIRSQIVHRSMEQNMDLALALADRLEELLTLRLRLVAMNAEQLGAAGRFDRVAVESFLELQLKYLSPAVRVAFMDADGIGVANLPAAGRDGRATAGFDYGGREYFKEVAEKRVPLIDRNIVVNKSDGIKVVILAAPVLDPKGAFRGVLVAAIGVAQIQDLARQYERGDDGDAQVAAADGTIIMFHDEYNADYNAAGRQRFDGYPIWPLVNSAPSGMIGSYLAADGRRRVAGFATVPSVGWKVWVGQPLAKIDADILRSYGAPIAWVAAAMLISIALSYGIVVLALRPIAALSATTAAIADGRYDRRVPEGGPQELAALTRSFNTMAAALARKIADEDGARAAIAAANEQLAAANKELEAFAYSVSHDLRTPLRAIDGFSRILMEEYAEKLDAEGRRLLDVVRDGTKKMSQLIDDILAFSRAGRVELASEAVDMESLAHGVLGDLLPAAKERKVEVEIAPLPRAWGDPATLRRVWVNLLDNAIKFTGPKAAPRIEIGATAAKGENTYYVRDNGVGFDMQYAGKLFGVFQRLHGPEEFPGTGIGLAIVNRIVARHGGRVWAEGKPGEGATFFFALPVKEISNG